MSNVSVLGNIAPGSDVYNISFRKWSGSVDSDHNESAAGDFYTKSAQIYVPRYRYLCERIIDELVDRKVYVFATDRNGDEHQISGAKFRSKFSTGKRASDSNGYEWTFTGTDRRKRFTAATTIKELTGNDYIPPPADTGEIGPADDPTIPIADGCCITILSTPIPDAPLAEGNILNLNKFVTVDGTGEKYFIDKHGKSIKLGGAGLSKERIIGTGASVYALTNIYDPDKVIINRTQNVLIRELSPPPTEIHTFNIVDDQLILPDDWPLDSGEYIEIYQVA
jgi:hypothetical protein